MKFAPITYGKDNDRVSLTPLVILSIEWFAEDKVLKRWSSIPRKPGSREDDNSYQLFTPRNPVS